MEIRRARPEDEAAIAALVEQLATAARERTDPGLKVRFMHMLALDHPYAMGGPD